MSQRDAPPSSLCPIGPFLPSMACSPLAPRLSIPGTELAVTQLARPQSRRPPRRRLRPLWAWECKLECEGGRGACARRQRGEQRQTLGDGAYWGCLEGPYARCGHAGGRRGRPCQPFSLGAAGRSREPRRPVLGVRGLRAGAWHWGVRTPNTISTPPIGICPGPIVRGFSPGTQPMGRAAAY